MIVRKGKLLKYFFLAFFFLLTSVTLFAQRTVVTGRVTDVLTNEPVPFANVAFKGTTTGAITDINGNYKIDTDKASDSLSASYVGYTPVTLIITKGKTQVANFHLKQSKVDLMEVVINAGENPALILLRKVIDNKEKNDKQNLDSYKYEVYSKMEFDMTDIPPDFKDKKLIKPFAFIFDNIDSSVSNSKPFLPFFITESLSDFYFKNNPKDQREIIKASKVSGLENESVNQFLGDMYQNVDVYSNYIDVFGKNFVSPISNVGTLYYKYYLTDSAFLGNQWCYKLKFKPRRKQELTFVGDCWVHDTTFAIRKIDMRVVEDANINFVEDLAVVKEYTRVNDMHWMLSKELLVVNFAPRKDGIGLIGRRSASYRDFEINKPAPDSVFSGAVDLKVMEESASKDDEFWATARHDSLSEREKQIYHMVDTIKQVPAFKTYVDIVTLFVTGYFDAGYFEIGPYFTLYSFNAIEGNRFKFGGRTSNKFNTRLRLEGYLAYGTKDETFKYMGGFRYYLKTKPREAIGARYKNDVAQLGQSENAFQDDNILSSLFRTNPVTKLTQLEGYRVYYEKEWFSGYSHKILLTHGRLSPLGELDYSYYPNYYPDEDTSVIKNTINTTEITFQMRFAYRERFIEGETGRISLGTEYPVTQLIYTAGLEGVFGSEFSYHTLIAKIDDNVPLPPFGYTYIALEAGKTWKTVPYPLLNVHQGNESYFYDYAAFNLMNYYEFISDQYASLFVVHHFEGFFLDKIPLLRKLKWREVASLRGVYGSLSDDNLAILVNPDDIGSLSAKPYVEAGFGVENILKILRFDFMYRLSYVDNPNISKFGIRGSLQFLF